jgi:hypothetical protein
VVKLILSRVVEKDYYSLLKSSNSLSLQVLKVLIPSSDYNSSEDGIDASTVKHAMPVMQKVLFWNILERSRQML